MNDFLRAVWWIGMFDKRTDHGIALVVQFVSSFSHMQFFLKAKQNGCQSCQCYCKKQKDSNFPWSVLSTKEMMSKCSKRCSETTCLWVMVSAEF